MLDPSWGKTTRELLEEARKKRMDERMNDLTGAVTDYKIKEVKKSIKEGAKNG